MILCKQGDVSCEFYHQFKVKSKLQKSSLKLSTHDLLVGTLSIGIPSNNYSYTHVNER